MLGSSFASPYAFAYAMAPSFTTASDTLGAPLRAIATLTALSMLARVAGGSEAWPASEVAARPRRTAANVRGRELFIREPGTH